LSGDLWIRQYVDGGWAVVPAHPNGAVTTLHISPRRILIRGRQADEAGIWQRCRPRRHRAARRWAGRVEDPAAGAERGLS
jgi:hypothetical protein